MRLREGTVVGDDFVVGHEIGRGSMGRVYLAVQRSTGRRRALKAMHVTVADDARQRERFVREARVTASISSVHVVEVVAAGVTPEGIPWLAMEHLEGDDLQALVEREGPLPELRVRHLLRQLCHALGAAHAQNVVHRDLKPQNLFVVGGAQTAEPMIKVLDFGIAKVLADTTGTASGALGSPAWMAPEQSEHASKIRPATDVWALGLLTFYVLTGARYWRTFAEGGGVMELLEEMLDGHLVPGSVRSRELGTAAPFPSALDPWLSTCLARDATARFANASEAWQAFDATRSRATDPPREPTFEPAPATVRMAPPAAAAVAPLTPPLPPASPEALRIGPPPSPTSRRWWLPWVGAAVVIAVLGGVAGFLASSALVPDADDRSRAPSTPSESAASRRSALQQARDHLRDAREKLAEEDHIDAGIHARWALGELDGRVLERHHDRAAPSSGTDARSVAANAAAILVHVRAWETRDHPPYPLPSPMDESMIQMMREDRPRQLDVVTTDLREWIDPWLDDEWRACARIYAYDKSLYYAEQLEIRLRGPNVDARAALEELRARELRYVQQTVDALATAGPTPSCAGRAEAYRSRAERLDGIIPGRRLDPVTMTPIGG